MSKRLDQERETTLSPKRMDFAKMEITKKGYEVTVVSETELQFEYMGGRVRFFPYSGWHSGKMIKDGRGLTKLLKQI